MHLHICWSHMYKEGESQGGCIGPHMVEPPRQRKWRVVHGISSVMPEPNFIHVGSLGLVPRHHRVLEHAVLNCSVPGWATSWAIHDATTCVFNDRFGDTLLRHLACSNGGCFYMPQGIKGLGAACWNTAGSGHPCEICPRRWPVLGCLVWLALAQPEHALSFASQVQNGPLPLEQDHSIRAGCSLTKCDTKATDLRKVIPASLQN